MEEHLYIVAYDISDPRRWRKVFKVMNGYGVWVQLSVFQCRMNRRRQAELVAKLDLLIDHREDHVVLVDVGVADSIDPRGDQSGQALSPAQARARHRMTALPLSTERSGGVRTPRGRSQVARSLTYIELWDIVSLNVANASPHLRISGHPSQPGQYVPAERRVNPGPFPPAKVGGLIEATRFMGMNIPGTVRFPPAKVGGLIEAQGPVLTPSNTMNSFRRQKSAASLKQ